MAKVTDIAKALMVRISLEEIRPEIWRRFAVRDHITLYELHEIIQTIMGWTNTHLYSFTIKAKEYSDQETIEESGKGKDAELVSLRSLKLKKGDTFQYMYDFGDNWEHLLVIELVSVPDPKVDYPVCLDGARSVPPEDCGGPNGYEDLLNILSDPTHAEFESMKEWVGPYYNPEEFDLNTINRNLHEDFEE